MLVFTVRAFRAKSKRIVGTNALASVRHRALLLTLLAKTNVIVWTFFLASVAGRNHMSVHTLITLLTMAFLKEISAHRDLVFMEDMQVVALVAFLALSFEPVNANDLLMFRLVGFEVLAFVERKELVKR